jgi:hypothetical protein
MTYVTLSPLGGSLDDTMAIQRALDTYPRGQVAKLSPGTFNINGKGLYFRETGPRRLTSVGPRSRGISGDREKARGPAPP